MKFDSGKGDRGWIFDADGNLLENQVSRDTETSEVVCVESGFANKSTGMMKPITLRPWDLSTELVFAILARKAFEVMRRRGWWAIRKPGSDRWMLSTIVVESGYCNGSKIDMSRWAICNEFDDPFTCLVEADKWCTENVEAIEKEFSL